MRTLSPATRKLIYLVSIAILIIPLSLIALPETRDKQGAIKNTGGQLSVLREKYSLSQAKLAEVDPASETMRLASLGLRGVAVSSLWMQAMEAKKKENYDQLASTLKTLTKIQPNFVQVWDYQAHNLAYNVSMEFDDYEYRYHWVKKGIGFLKEGVAYNKSDHRMTDKLGLYTGNKIGKSDEKESFRRMFGYDTEFHKLMEAYIDRESYETRGYGHNYDNWLMAFQWYDWSRRKVEQGMEKKTSDMIFYNNQPNVLRQQGLSLQQEFRPDESQKQVWQRAQDELKKYGQIEMTNSLGVKYTMEEIGEIEQKIDTLRKQLDEMVPGMRNDLTQKALADLKVSENSLAAWRLPIEERSDEQRAIARDIDMALNQVNNDIDYRIARDAPPDQAFKAQTIAREIEELKAKQFTINKDTTTMNYAFWKDRCKAESSDIGLVARQAMFEAEAARQKAIYDDEMDRNYRTKEVRVIRRGALTLYEDAFEKFKAVFDENPDLREGVFGDEIVEEIKKYESILKLTGREWPEKFPLQDFIDYRATMSLPDELPTSIELEDRKANPEGEGGEAEANQPDQGKTIPPVNLPGKKLIETDPNTNQPKDDSESKGGTQPK